MSARALLAAAALVLAAPPRADGAPYRLGDDVVPLDQTVSLRLDPARDDYTGSVTVELEVKRPVRSFRFHALGPRITSLRLERDGRAVETRFASAEHATVEVTAATPLAPGRHRLALEFENAFGRQAVGLYKVVHQGEPYLYSQLQAIDARRAFPCWDEPSFKIPWQITVVAPAGHEAISNAPVERATDEGGSRTVVFERTPPLPSYLVALAVGRFDTLPIPGLGVPARVVAPRGQASLGRLAAEVTPPLLAALERYFGSRYPFEKLDLIAVPEYWFGAMENPGAITFRDTILLIDATTATATERKRLIDITAHELAHMWFGDLVTMAWWDDFWLNESFADWMAKKIAAEVHPELELEMEMVQSAQEAMDRDARPATRAIRLVGIAPGEAMRTVVNAYDKGTGILRMFEGFAGKDRFREGLVAYFAAHAWGNADTTEFFTAAARHAPPGTAEALQTFVTQPGVPLVTVERLGPRRLRLVQSRFVSTGRAPPLSWRIPVTLRLGRGATASSTTFAVLLDSAEKIVELPATADWIFPQADAAGYYRWRLPDDELAALPASGLSAPERLALAGNSRALFVAGALGGDAYLEVLDRLASDADPQIAEWVVGQMTLLRHVFDAPATRAALAAYIRRRLRPMLERIGLERRAGESPNLGLLRPKLLRALAVDGEDPDARRLAREQAARYLADPASIDPSLAAAVLGIHARDGDLALFEEYRRRFEAARTPTERSRFLAALAGLGRPETRRRALAYVLEGPLRPTELNVIPLGGLETARERERTFRWSVQHHDELTKRMPAQFHAFLPVYAEGCEPERVARARAFFARRSVEGTHQQLDRVAERTAECAALRAREMKRVAARLRR